MGVVRRHVHRIARPHHEVGAVNVDDSAGGEHVQDVVTRVGMDLELAAGLQYDAIDSDAHPYAGVLARARSAEDSRQDRAVRMQQGNVGVAENAPDVLSWIKACHYTPAPLSPDSAPGAVSSPSVPR